MNLHHLWKIYSLYDKKGMVEKVDNVLKKVESTLTVLDNCNGDESSDSDN